MLTKHTLHREKKGGGIITAQKELGHPEQKNRTLAKKKSESTEV
jgi:hypothetical protein